MGESTLQQGMARARKAISIDQRDYIAHWALSRLHNAQGEYQSALSELETAVNINPNFVHAYHGLATVHTHAGRPEKLLEWSLERWGRGVALCTAFQAEGMVPDMSHGNTG